MHSFLPCISVSFTVTDIAWHQCIFHQPNTKADLIFSALLVTRKETDFVGVITQGRVFQLCLIFFKSQVLCCLFVFVYNVLECMVVESVHHFGLRVLVGLTCTKICDQVHCIKAEIKVLCIYMYVLNCKFCSNLSSSRF